MARRRGAAVLDGRGNIGSVRPLVGADLASLEELLARELAGRMQARLGRLVDGLEGDGRVARNAAGAPIGLVSWVIGGADSRPRQAEIRVLLVEPAERRTGVGGALLTAAEASLRGQHVVSAWLVTTNDNLEALRFYQRRAWRLVAVHPGAIDVARATLKPGIAAIGEHGIPIRDEVVLSKEL